MFLTLDIIKTNFIGSFESLYNLQGIVIKPEPRKNKDENGKNG